MSSIGSSTDPELFLFPSPHTDSPQDLTSFEGSKLVLSALADVDFGNDILHFSHTGYYGFAAGLAVHDGGDSPAYM